MANNYNVYTDEIYLNKSSLQKALNTSIIDPYWNAVSEYRRQHRFDLTGLKTLNGRPLFVTLTPAIKDKIDALSYRVHLLSDRLSSFRDLIEASQAKKACLSIIATDIRSITHNPISDISIKALVSDTYFESNPLHKEVVNHFDAISYYGEKNPKDMDEETLYELYAKCITPDEIVALYRRNDIDSQIRRLMYMPNAVYPYCPGAYVENVMKSFENWAINGNGQSLLKAIVALYYIDRAKPFPSMNQSVAILLAKWMVSANSLKAFDYYSPFEILATRDDPAGEYASNEVQKTGDFTYFLDWALKKLNSRLDDAFKAVDSSRVEAYVNEAKSMSEIEEEAKKQEETFSIIQDQVPPAPEPVEEPIPEPVAEPEPVVVEEPITVEEPTPESEPIKEEPVVEPEPIVEPEPVEEVKPQVKEKKKSDVEMLDPSKMSSSTSIFAPTLTDKEVKEYIIYLMETEPDLNKKQASFYATHCTEGRYYTIQQFKAHAKCVYETARTSMDKLAAKGFYKKCQVKNKFVYTPVKKRR